MSSNDTNMSGLPPLPPDLSALDPYLQRAQQMASHDPAVSYWCKMHVARQAFKCLDANPDIRAWILAFVDCLEKEKNFLRDKFEAVADVIVAQKHVYEFANNCFQNAKNEDLAPPAPAATLRTAKVYLAASHYFDVTATVFEDDDPQRIMQLRENSRFAKLRAAEIVRAIKAGNVPPPPGGLTPNPDVPATDGFANLPAQTSHQSKSPSGSNYEPRSSTQTESQSGTWQDQRSAQPPPLHQVPQQAERRSSLGATGALAVPPAVATQATKNARFAISALEYDDLPTAIENLEKALALLRSLQSGR